MAGMVTPAGFGFSCLRVKRDMVGAPFHFGVTGTLEALSPWFPHPAKSANPRSPI
jgi:hypothetical protein